MLLRDFFEEIGLLPQAREIALALNENYAAARRQGAPFGGRKDRLDGGQTEKRLTLWDKTGHCIGNRKKIVEDRI